MIEGVLSSEIKVVILRSPVAQAVAAHGADVTSRHFLLGCMLKRFTT